MIMYSAPVEMHRNNLCLYKTLIMGCHVENIDEKDIKYLKHVFHLTYFTTQKLMYVHWQSGTQEACMWSRVELWS